MVCDDDARVIRWLAARAEKRSPEKPARKDGSRVFYQARPRPSDADACGSRHIGPLW
jgi:hypothetical protein